MVIDGGFSEAYLHNETGIAGYTLVYHSRGFQLVQHEPFTSQRDAIVRETDIKSTTQIVEMSAHRMLVADTDKGEELKRQVADLKKLLYAYRHGISRSKPLSLIPNAHEESSPRLDDVACTQRAGRESHLLPHR